ncbi:MAG: DUF5654 family protein [Candidatus Pacearchaeota archaeon]|jgi:hypothetical protein
MKNQKNKQTKKLSKIQLAKEKARLARQRAKNSANKFKSEIKKAVVTAIVAAFGFLIALSWKEVITEWVDVIIKSSPVQGKLISAIIVTVISVLGIIIVTKFFSDKTN